MLRRLYYSFRGAPHARRMVSELKAACIDESQLHAFAKAGVDLSGLPLATEAQRWDRVWILENLFWRGDLVLFGLGTVIFVVALILGWILWAIAAFAVMLASFAAGNWFSVRLPHAHMDDMRIPLKLGRVLLMIDVPQTRVREIEQMASRHHPEADLDGVGWTIRMLGT